MIRLALHRSSLSAWLAPLALACAFGSPAGAAAAAAGLRADTGKLDFGLRQAGASAAHRTVVVTNTGTTDLALDTPGLSIPAGFSVGEDSSCIGLLRAGASCRVTVAYRAKTAGAARAILTVGSGAQQVRIVLSGAGAAPALQVQPAAYLFPARMLGRSAPPKAFTLTNTGRQPVPLHAARFQGPFRLVAGGCPPAPFTLAPGKACELRAAFTPTRPGAVRGALTLDSPAAPGGWQVGLAGLAADPARRVVLGGADDPAMLFLCAAAAGVLAYRWRHHKRTGGHVG